MKLIFCTVIVTIIITFSSQSVFSQEAPGIDTGSRELLIGVGFPDYSERFQGRIGLAVGFEPDYEGSDDISAAVLPLVEIGKPGVFFLKGATINPNDGISSAGMTIFHLSYIDNSKLMAQVIMGPLVRVNIGRNEDDSKILDGLGDIDPSVGIGGFIDFNKGSSHINFAIASQNAGDDKDGFLATLDLKYTFSISNNLTFSPIVSTSWANDDYMQGFFSVTKAQSRRSGLRHFDGEAGFKDIGVQFHASYAITEHLSVDGQAGYWRLLNDAAESPIVKDEGTNNQFRGLVGLTYNF